MNRRGFLGTLAAAAAGFALDPERLLWVPGQKTIFLPTVGVYSGNTLLTPSIVTLEALRVLENTEFRMSFVDAFYAETLQ